MPSAPATTVQMGEATPTTSERRHQPGPPHPGDRLGRSSPIGLGLLDADLRFLDVNETFAGLVGAPPEAHVGRDFEEMFPHTVQKVMRVLRRLVAGEKRLAATTLSFPQP